MMLEAQGAIIDCTDGPSSVHNIVEPLDKSTRTYANGTIRILHLDTGGEPACCSSYMAILAPDPVNELGDRQCKLLADTHSGLGFMAIELQDIQSSYDPAQGLLLRVPVRALYRRDQLEQNQR